eukprot:TRINITY_DN22601_c0_g1_i1.p1 TRINITY_DN22601_c0_g1~~TRINITY_DN22601_c0_g1_i1.p1  ORF type:complete len:809 (-),score=227.40 TRINITY_DN22601_c0_g1_i1:104-2530(-)
MAEYDPTNHYGPGQNLQFNSINSRSDNRSEERKYKGKYDFICRHYLLGSCKEGNACKYRHNYDESKKPMCLRGVLCQEQDHCPFRHHKSDVECEFFNQGFCKDGLSCINIHSKKPIEFCPEIADVIKESAAKFDDPFYKTTLCKQYMNGRCQLGDFCIQAHGETELRSPPKQGEAFGTETAVQFDISDTSFLIEAPSYDDFAIMVKNSSFVYAGDMVFEDQALPKIRQALENSRLCFLFFSVHQSNEILAFARVTGEDQMMHNIKLEWHRVIKGLDMSPLQDMTNSRTGRPVSMLSHCEEIDMPCAQHVLHQIYKAEQVLPFAPSEMSANATFPSVVQSNERGFIFACNNETKNTCLDKNLFGLPRKPHYEQKISFIHPGTPLFLLNGSDRTLLGIFEAVTPVIQNIDPSAWRGHAGTSRFPMQVRVRKLVDCPPLTDRECMAIFGERVRLSEVDSTLVQQLEYSFLKKRQDNGLPIPGIDAPMPKPLSEIVQQNPSMIPNSMGMNMNMGGMQSSTGQMVSGYGDRPFKIILPVPIPQDANSYLFGRLAGRGGCHFRQAEAMAGGRTRITMHGGPRDKSLENRGKPIHLSILSDNAESMNMAAAQMNESINRLVNEYQRGQGGQGGQNPMGMGMQMGGAMGMPQGGAGMGSFGDVGMGMNPMMMQMMMNNPQMMQMFMQTMQQQMGMDGANPMATENKEGNTAEDNSSNDKQDNEAEPPMKRQSVDDNRHRSSSRRHNNESHYHRTDHRDNSSRASYDAMGANSIEPLNRSTFSQSHQTPARQRHRDHGRQVHDTPSSYSAGWSNDYL